MLSAPIQIRRARLNAAAREDNKCDDGEDARRLYWELLNDSDEDIQANTLRNRSRLFLVNALRVAEKTAAEIPADHAELKQWMSAGTAEVGAQYQAYLTRRRAGAPRQYFTNKSHALYFINAAAPTKLVDGAWLYGLLPHWKNPTLAPLIKIYLEELGEGTADKNHVVLYKQLLAANGCDNLENLPADYFIQGALQLSLAQHTEDFFPEVLGFNLGYEQLPLHLLITAYELKELGIDPYYFTLHVTIDNVHSGHALKAVQGLLDYLPRVENPAEFYRRVIRGYKLNLIGAGTTDIIGRFDLEKSLVAMLQEKSKVGKYMHADRCRFGGRTISDWLRNPQHISAFLDALADAGWIKRHQDPSHSRFWQLLTGDKPAMFGVFSTTEKQLIYDWIAGNCASGNSIAKKWTAGACDSASLGAFDLNGDVHHLKKQLEVLKSTDAIMSRLLPLLAPSHHHTPVGLVATQLFVRNFGCR